MLYRSAIEVMRAHYIAGLAALDNGDRAIASEMFSHPISEIYVDLEPVIESLGGQAMMDEMNRAAVLHFQDASGDEIRAAVDEVVRLLDVNQDVAPEADPAAAPAVHAAVLASLIERAALQYEFAAQQEDASGAWLDGYGLERAAARYAETTLDDVRAADADGASAIADALDLLATAYPGAQPPETYDPEPAVVLEAANAAADAAGAMDAAPASDGAAGGG
ncbi:hypothetical protein DDZ18_11040 [Marinicauda salina]|uniref:Uncharacterized protein n=1 Tax=Marinicauda salina TaxID=2135793 RepID=A0A2U2BRU1_9PROT|nr:hypothetical protein DDZ18_11040 [Marinicauda salina]